MRRGEEVMVRRCQVWLGMALAALFSAVLTSTGAAAATVTLRAVTAWPTNDDIQNRGFMMFLRKVEQRSGGRIRVNWVGGPEAIPPFELGEAARRGLVDLAWVSAAYYLPNLPEAAVFDFSELTVQEERASGAFEYINRIHQRKMNVYVLGRGSAGVGYSIYTTQPVAKVDDFRGLRIRVSPVYVPFVRALGATPVVMPGGEIYTALERGVVQGFTWPEIGIRVFKWDEVIKYKVYPPYWQIDIVNLINLDRWQKLPKEVQDTLLQISLEVEKELPAVFAPLVRQENAALRAKGIQIVYLAAEERAKYRNLARSSAWEWVRQNVKEDPETLIRLFSKTRS
jgi:TRAP-type C4-dicarboxylate transport system substrate-binding protein